MSNENEDAKATEPQSLPPQLASAAALRAKAAELLAQAGEVDRAVAEAELARREARKPKQPDVEHGSAVVVGFTKYQSGRTYAYAAVGWRYGNAVRWTVTGQTTDRFNWPGLLQFIGEANWPSMDRLTGVERLGPDPEDEEPVAERMGTFGRVLGSYSPGGVVDPLVRATVPQAHGGVGGGGRGGFAAGGVVFGGGSPFGREREGGY
ncbi:hypothetical protein FDI63_gp091 [Mycobacterium phage ChrisnMich]|uniref:Uncharacterized protein n=1 Tax=Mycobacterium phage ChrisnMich TaxID=1034130 RepID=G1BLE8_9CAUD|nr:hypothetical protein FDI63_gp091 [Mycobacterium phage ChrisnMich]AEJ94615.1 hypothetical protein CHRISNMICH_91 [Mycobacterium phage ChrisnMich]